MCSETFKMLLLIGRKLPPNSRISIFLEKGNLGIRVYLEIKGKPFSKEQHFMNCDDLINTEDKINYFCNKFNNEVRDLQK